MMKDLLLKIAVQKGVEIAGEILEGRNKNNEDPNSENKEAQAPKPDIAETATESNGGSFVENPFPNAFMVQLTKSITQSSLSALGGVVDEKWSSINQDIKLLADKQRIEIFKSLQSERENFLSQAKQIETRLAAVAYKSAGLIFLGLVALSLALLFRH